MKKYYCDKCKKEIEDKVEIRIQQYHHNGWITKEYDTCVDCAKQLRKYIRG